MGAWDAYLGVVSNGDDTYMNQKFVHTAEPFKDNGDGTGAYALYKILYDAVADGLIEDGCMVLGSWAYSQMVDADSHGEDVGYMPFPMSVNGTQYALAGGDYSYCINVNSSDDNKAASLVFIKWMTEKSNWCYNEGGYIVVKGAENPEMNAESELSFNAGGNDKVQRIVEAAATGSETYDDIMADWTKAWNDAQAELGVEVNN